MNNFLNFILDNFWRSRPSDYIMRIAQAVVLAFSLLIVFLSVFGGYQHFSPVPFWDMWNGMLEFLYNVDSGDSSAWLAQHNDHRIFLARILFWLDENTFGGAGVFLVTVNYAIVALTAFVFWRIINKIGEVNFSVQQKNIMTLAVTACLFLWTQKDNLTSGFQSEFFLVQLLPLCALYFLSFSVESQSSRPFFLACVFGVLSVGTMVNGILILPLMFVYSLFFRQGGARSFCLLALAVLSTFLYFYQYQYAQGEGGFLKGVISSPRDLIVYTAMYMGNIFYYLFGQGGFGKTASMLAGFLFILVSAVTLYLQILKKGRLLL